MLSRILSFITRNLPAMLGSIPLVAPAIGGLRHLWMHEPLRLLYILGVGATSAYDMLNGGIGLENALFALAALILTELGRANVTSPATADPNHVDA